MKAIYYSIFVVVLFSQATSAQGERAPMTFHFGELTFSARTRDLEIDYDTWARYLGDNRASGAGTIEVPGGAKSYTIFEATGWTYCVDRGNMSAMMSSSGLLHCSAQSRPFKKDLPSAYVGNFARDENKNDAATQASWDWFTFGHYYIFYFSRDLGVKNAKGKKALLDFHQVATSLIEIVHLTPTFTFTVDQNDLAPADQFVSYTETRFPDSPTPSREFSFVRAGEDFDWTFDGQEGRVTKNSVPAQMFFYVFAKLKWEPIADSRPLAEKTPVIARLELMKNGRPSVVEFHYVYGRWYYKAETGQCYQTYFPNLMYEVRGKCRETARRPKP